MFARIHPSLSSGLLATRLSPSLTHTVIFTTQSYICMHCVILLSLQCAHIFTLTLWCWPHVVDIFIGSFISVRLACSQGTGLEHGKSKQREEGNKLLFKNCLDKECSFCSIRTKHNHCYEGMWWGGSQRSVTKSNRNTIWVPIGFWHLHGISSV